MGGVPFRWCLTMEVRRGNFWFSYVHIRGAASCIPCDHYVGCHAGSLRNMVFLNGAFPIVELCTLPMWMCHWAPLLHALALKCATRALCGGGEIALSHKWRNMKEQIWDTRYMGTAGLPHFYGNSSVTSLDARVMQTAVPSRWRRTAVTPWTKTDQRLNLLSGLIQSHANRLQKWPLGPPWNVLWKCVTT